MNNQINMDEQGFLSVLELGRAPFLHAVLTTAIELNLFEIIGKAGPDAQLSPAEIASHLPTKNQEAPIFLDRMLQLLASYSILECTLVSDKDAGNMTTRLYGLTPLSKYFVQDEEGISLAAHLLFVKELRDCWYCLKDAVLDGGIPINKAHEMNLYEFVANNSRRNDLFNQSISCYTSISLRRLIEKYKGFEDLKEIVDVGGGLGDTLRIIISKYHWIRGINYDLPQVIRNAPAYPGVEHVEGDMFDSVPKGEAILLKHVLHNWSDECCLKILKNCWNALPITGKVIILEIIVSESPATDLLSKVSFGYDITMLLVTHGGKERTPKELENFAKGAGFAASKFVCQAYEYGIFEFYKY